MLGRAFANHYRKMKLKEIMTRRPEVVRPDEPVQEAARKMRDLNVGVMPVCDGVRLHGMISDRDIAIRAAAEALDCATVETADVMTPGVVWCYEDQDVEVGAELMKEKQVRRLVILDRDKMLVGIVSLGDLAVESGDLEISAETLERVSEPVGPHR